MKTAPFVQSASGERKVSMKTLVIGSTGMAGSLIIEGLMNRNVSVRCMSRSGHKISHLPKGIEGFVADLEKPDTLAAAFEGVHNLFLLVPVSRTETLKGMNAIQAARRAAVRKIVYLSVYMPEGSTVIPHFKSKIPIENAIKESGIDYTILRPNNFFQNDLAILSVVTGYGIYPTPVGAIGLNRIDARDVAECALNALTRSGHEGRVYSVHGPDTLNGGDTARIYGKYAGRNVRYAGDDLDVWIQHVRNIMPEWMYRDFGIMYRYFQDHGMVAPQADLEKQQLLLGRKPARFEDFANEAVQELKKSLACAA
jgi:uncharacterized protein YbjT (DUF2867 family)